MKALAYLGKGDIRWIDRPIPTLKKSTDVLVRIHKTTICGTDLHILRGNVETVTDGRILGHEGIGTVEAIGEDVKKFKKGDRVLVSCITSCGQCDHCKINFYGHCKDGGWQLGNTIDGCQAEYVLIPHGDYSLHALPESAKANTVAEEAFIMLSDILPTGLEVGIMDGKLREGATLAVVGVGPVGLAAIMAATTYKPSKIFAIDIDRNRLEVAHSFGATDLIDNSDKTEGKTGCDQIMAATKGKGVDVVIEAIGTPTGWDISENIVAAGGNIAVLGVHGKSVTLHLEKMWKRNFTLTAGLVHTHTIPSLMERVVNGEIQPLYLISHRFKLSEIQTAYNVFGNASTHRSLKVIMENDYV